MRTHGGQRGTARAAFIGILLHLHHGFRLLYGVCHPALQEAGGHDRRGPPVAVRTVDEDGPPVSSLVERKLNRLVQLMQCRG